MNHILRVRNLSTGFATTQGIARAVEDVSFDLVQGETLGLVGESGCGKTVTALSILRLITKPGQISSESIVEFDGSDLMRLTANELREIRGAMISMVFQEPSACLNPVLSVGTQIVETVRAHRQISKKDARSRAVELLELVGIPDPHKRISEYPHQLSGGMQQRVMIAIALSCNPKILIADEPTTALDVTIQAQILELLADLKSRLGMSVILITHDLGVVAGIANRVAVMYGGSIVELSPTREMFSNPAHPYTQALMRAIPKLHESVNRLETIPGAVPPSTRWPSGCRFHPRCSQAFEKCTESTPPLFETDPNRLARCWLVEKSDRSQV